MSCGSVLTLRQEPLTRELGRLFPAAFARTVARSWGNGHFIGDGGYGSDGGGAGESATGRTVGTGTEALVVATDAYASGRMSPPAHDGP
ncbi:hypothetical protein [Streptomyces sp. Ru62]|uniref:hypothetical protein n=1 Tax=Streptomyces sp. Ru62 TaxID=2080745 RepID=UPI0011B0E6C7|nr:hypothetical protein [Streptomyces sp. Ru62]